MSESEDLRDMITVLELARKREQSLRQESEYILEALQVLNNESDPESILERSLSVLKEALHFDAAFVINRSPEGEFIGQGITDPVFDDSLWQAGAMMERVMQGETVALYDISKVPEWQTQPADIRRGVQSALHIPLSGLQSSVMMVCTHAARGRFHPGHSNLARRFGILTSQIFKSIEFQNLILQRNSVMERDLHTARRIQASIVEPPVPEFKEMKAAYRYKPLDAVGGDFFNMHRLDDQSLGVFVGDVAGHGVSAALFLSLLKFNSDRAGQHYGRNPAAYLNSINEQLFGLLGRSFLTAVYGAFIPHNKGMQLSLVKGGHPAPIYYNSRKKECQMLHTPGPLLGVFKQIELDEIRLDLNKGDRVFFYTDGLSEVRTIQGSLLDEQTMQEVFQKAQQRDLQKTVDAIIEEILQLKSAPNPEDDILLIGVEYTGKRGFFG